MRQRAFNESATSQRLFFALWPDVSLQQQMFAAADSALRQFESPRRARRENLHLTLAFLGSVNAEVGARLQREADTIRARGFDLTLDQLGVFARRGLVWLGPLQVPAPLLDVVAALRSAQSAVGLIPEKREYRAHITLVRDLATCPPPGPVAPIVWPVRQFVLVESKPGARGSRYQVLHRWDLVARAHDR